MYCLFHDRNNGMTDIDESTSTTDDQQALRCHSDYQCDTLCSETHSVCTYILDIKQEDDPSVSYIDPTHLIILMMGCCSMIYQINYKFIRLLVTMVNNNKYIICLLFLLMNVTADPNINVTTDPYQYPEEPSMVCFNAKYKNKMFAKTNDYLDGNEYLVSFNCKCKLEMKKRGNLILYEKGITNEFEEIWKTNTTIYNYSAESIPRMDISNDGIITINEYLYKNVPAISPIKLWQSTIANKSENNLNVALYLSNTCCLMIINDDDMNNNTNTATWSVCDDLSVPNIEPTKAENLEKYATSANIDNEPEIEISRNTGNIYENLWSLWLLVAVCSLIPIFCIFFGCKKYRRRRISNSKWVKPPMPTPSSFESNDDESFGFNDNEKKEEQEGGEQNMTEIQIAEWIKETKYDGITTHNKPNIVDEIHDEYDDNIPPIPYNLSNHHQFI